VFRRKRANKADEAIVVEVGEPASERPPSAAPAILVVDDDYHVRQIVRQVLEEDGYQVLVARDGNDALALLAAAEGTIDLALIDFNLPGMHGRHLAVEVSVLSPETRILYLSGQPSDTLADYGVSQDNWLVQKPFTHAELRNRVAERLQD
jgi:two-component system cell cycle sensor histidine kinase/response regulator CckA